MKPTETSEEKIAVVILAAGESSRLGQPKQLLPYQGQSLIRRDIQVAREAGAGEVMVVIGAHANALKKEISDCGVQVVENTAWQEGMASSIRCGIKALQTAGSSAEGVILMVCDQPHVTAALLKEIMQLHQQTGKTIVTCSYGDTFGPPVYFHKRLFAELLQLSGDVGAREVVRKHANEVAVVPFSKGVIDIDTAADYQKLTQGNTQ